MAGQLTPRSRRRHAALLLLAAVVGVVHLMVAEVVGERLATWQAGAARPSRLQAAFVRELVATAPPEVPATPPAPAPVRKARAATPATPAASAPAPASEAATASVEEPQAAASAPAPAASAVPPLPDPVPAGPAPEIAAASAGALAPPPAASAPVFDWPASTRLSYVLHGYYRGEMHGSAQVEWLREGERYQVHLDVTVGLPFAPLFTRRMSSDGHLVAGGLAPRRYDEETRRAFSAPRRSTMHFDDDAIALANGRRVPTLPGVQDTASQFVQLIWLFTMQPDRLQAGREIEMPLALPREVGRWVYDVLGVETVYAPFGAVEAVHLKPRRPARPDTLAVETWVAPTLQYLPVRIRIHQDAETYVDLIIERPPLQAAPEGGR